MMGQMSVQDAPAGGERIAKVIARAGLGSRRQAEAWIGEGRVAVNGEAISSPARNVTAADRVTVDGKPLPARERTRLFLYHKPRGLVTTRVDPQGRPTIFAALPGGLPRLISIGRLDLNTEGLLLLTNDGGLARVLELPATGWLRRYRVRAHGRVQQDALDRLRHGIAIDGVRYGPIEATLERAQGSNVWLSFAMREGKNREVKNVLSHLGLAVNRLIRLSFGPFQLGDLAEGTVEEVRTRTLREQLGERLAALAGADFSAPLAEHAPTRSLHPPIQSTRAPPAPTLPTAHKGSRGEGKLRRGRHFQPDLQNDGTGMVPRVGKRRRKNDERLGGPELARREKRRRRKSFQGKGPEHSEQAQHGQRSPRSHGPKRGHKPHRGKRR
jgi:23S rRNA pseudouridine2605 synthase